MQKDYQPTLRKKVEDDGYNTGSYFFDGKIMTTEKIVDFFDRKNSVGRNRKIEDQNILIPLCNQLHMAPEGSIVKTRLAPYLLGVLIGDGCLTSVNGCAAYTTIDSFIDEKIKNLGYKVLVRKNATTRNISDKTGELRAELKRIGLWGKYSYEKSIPKYFKRCKIEEKIELIQGLMDTDGYVDAGGSMSYTSTSKQLVKDFQEIIWSLGRLTNSGLIFVLNVTV